MQPAANDYLASELERNGFAIRGFFDASEIARLRETAVAHLTSGGVPQVPGVAQPNAGVEVPALAWLYTSDKVISLFRRALGVDDIVFTGHCDLQRDLRSNWHKDSGSGPGDYFNGAYFAADDCKVYKIGVYLEDHIGDATGLTVQPATHRTVATNRRDPGVPLDTKAGDVILFDVRLTHRGQAPDLIERVLGRAASVFRRLGWRSNGLLRLCESVRNTTGRYAVFFTFGYPNVFTEDFARGNMRRQLVQTGNLFKPLQADLAKELEARGVRLASVLTGSNRDTPSAR